MATKRFNFTKAAVNELVALPTRYYVRDTNVAGLIVDVTPNGVKTFRFYKKIAGKPERITIGRFPDLTIEQARGKAHSHNAAIAQGDNPAATRRSVTGEMTLGELLDVYIDRHARKYNRSWEQDRKVFNRYLKHWAGRKLSSIDRNEVGRLHTAIGREAGPFAANRILSLLSSVFNRALLDFGWEGTVNPARGVKKFEEKSRDRFLNADELPAFFAALKAEHDTDARDALLVMLLTGARKMNVLSMRWEDVRLERGIWTIPLTKSGESQRVPLIPFVVDLLAQRRAFTNGSDYVFPGRRGDTHRVEIKACWERIRHAANIPDVRMHDLRRTFGSFQAAAGVSLPIIGKSMGHKNASTTAIYARLNLDPVRAAVTMATTAMLKAGSSRDVEENNEHVIR